MKNTFFQRLINRYTTKPDENWRIFILLQLREKQVEVDKLQYELGASSRRSQTELTSLRQKVSELELQLLEARKEADEYYRSNLERNMEVTSLGQEVS